MGQDNEWEGNVSLNYDVAFDSRGYLRRSKYYELLFEFVNSGKPIAEICGVRKTNANEINRVIQRYAFSTLKALIKDGKVYVINFERLPIKKQQVGRKYGHKVKFSVKDLIGDREND